MIDVSKIRIGDEVTVRVTVRDADLRGSIRVTRDPWLRSDDIVAHHPKPREFKPGDRVTACHFPDVRTIVAVDNGEAWIRSPLGGHHSASFESLRHADESE